MTKATTITGESFELGPSVRFEHGTVLRDCRVVSKLSARRLGFGGVTMIGGVFEQKTPLRNHCFNWNRFEGVRFRGRFDGCDWGFLPEFDVRDYLEEDDPRRHGPPLGAMEACDFSEATLDYCRLFGCDLERIALPRWPCFTVPYPAATLAPLVGTWGNPELEIRLAARDTSVAHGTVALILDARTVAGGSGMTLPALRALLMRIPGVLVLDAVEGS